MGPIVPSAYAADILNDNKLIINYFLKVKGPKGQCKSSNSKLWS
uniref:Uncharacterized protein n=1 Tax=Rhizophora mucronata TaxID=61149 RepID=A0A2P2P6Z9_RHIMU